MVALRRSNPSVQDILRKVKKALGLVEIEAELHVGRCFLARCSKNLPFRFCIGNLALRGKCGAACEMPERIGHSHARARCRQPKNVVPAMEPNQHEGRIGYIGLRHRHVMEHGSCVRGHFVGGLFGVREIAGHAVAGREKVKIVTVIHHVVHAARGVALPEIGAVSVRRQRIASSCCSVISHSHVGVRGHMHQMAGTGGERFQTLCAG